MADSPLLTGVDAYNAWQSTILTGTPDVRWEIGSAFDHIEVGPGRIVLLGGAPGSGKTALVLQWVFDALILNQQLRAIIANVEMSPSRLFDRQLARFSGVQLNLIRGHRVVLSQDLDQIAKAVARIQKIMDRLGFVRGPFTLQRIADAADECSADLIVIDYAQRIEMEGKFNGMREKTNAMMSKLREMADCGIGILAAAALTRSRDGKGRSSYEGKHLSLASFRESSELEYGCDDAFLLYPSDSGASLDDPDRPVTLAHVKSRDGETQSVDLMFHRRVQRFEPNVWVPPASPSAVRFVRVPSNGAVSPGSAQP